MNDYILIPKCLVEHFTHEYGKFLLERFSFYPLVTITQIEELTHIPMFFLEWDEFVTIMGEKDNMEGHKHLLITRSYHYDKDELSEDGSGLNTVLTYKKEEA